MPWVAPVIGAAIGGIQAIAGGSKARKNERALQAQVDSFQPNSGIIGLYDKALAKYSANPYTGTAYQQQNNQIQRNLATGIMGAANIRMGLGAIAGLTQQANDASARAVVNAEGVENQNFGRLQQTAAMRAAEQQRKFDMIYNLTALKAGQGASTANTGISNFYSGLSSAATSIGQYGWDGKSGYMNNPISK